uniref:Uncharacterized protein n=1 Tax=Arundo donax TaxID=35708 RepID=A0A0A9G168_ARUDO
MWRSGGQGERSCSSQVVTPAVSIADEICHKGTQLARHHTSINQPTKRSLSLARRWT